MDDNKPDRIEQAKVIAIYGFIALVVAVVLMDRFVPAALEGYEPLGDTSLGLLLGAVTALIIGEGVTRAGKD